MTNQIKRLIGLSFALALVLSPQSAAAQGISFSVGPQVSTLGVGVSASARLTPKLGFSAEYSLFPFSSTEKSAFDNSVLLEPSLQGGLVMVTFHPSGGKFAIGAGLQTGGASADALISLDPAGQATIALGNNEYTAAQIGNLVGTFEYGTAVQPAAMIGWIGGGFNFAVGASMATPELTLEASGPIKSDAGFQADLALETADFDDSVGSVPVYPYLRIGWQFSF
ncbi:MAG: hypothetical protein ACI9W4_001516 [Rhodothermales bacterium]|jgi:hypothetical protein